MTGPTSKYSMPQGRPQDLGGEGARIFFLRFGNLHVAKQHAAHGEAMRFARGVREKFHKLCNLVRFGVYLDQIFYSKKFQKVPFFI